MIDHVDFVSLLRVTECGLLKHDNRSRFASGLTSNSERTSVTSADRELSCSSTDLSNSMTTTDYMSESTDVLGQLEPVQLRSSGEKRREKSMRLSLPSAINSAGDRIREKLKSGGGKDKKEKSRLKDLRSSGLTHRKSFSQERDSPQNDVTESTDNCISRMEDQSSRNQTEGVVFKSRYTPENEKQFDTWNTGAPDAPLADPEGDSPLFTEAPSRSFPLSHMPSQYHGDYDTAFALASLKGDCLSYQTQVHSLVEPTLSKTNSLGLAASGAGNSSVWWCMCLLAACSMLPVTFWLTYLQMLCAFR